MMKDELFNFSDRIMSHPALVKILFIQIFLFALLATGGFAQERTAENPMNHQSIPVSDSLTLVMSDSLKLLETKRIYEIPVQYLKEKKGKNNSNQPIKESNN